ncbi:MAG: glycosyltransferase family 1 protein [Patescibacteria group bacterium]|nr:glycosyltransferase family 1 protein [Patescibacteria group bacterium]
MIIGIEASHANKEKRTGVEEYCWQIIQHLKKNIPADVRVILYSQTPLLPVLSDLPPNWQPRVLPWVEKLPRRLRKGWTQTRLSWEFLHRPPDVFFAPAQILPLICPEKVVATIHDSVFEVDPKAAWWASRWYLKLMNRLILKKARLILTPSEFSKNELKRLYNYDTGRVRVTPLGFDSLSYRRFDLPDEAKKEILGRFKITKPFFISVGRLEEKKNTANIVRAFNLFREKHEAQLVLVGFPGVGYKDVATEIEHSPHKADIILPGWGTKADIAKLYNLAEALVFPSKYEGFGLPVLEAMACGCPVIASEGNSMVEAGGDAVFYVSADSPEQIASVLERIFANQDERQKMAALGLARAATFSWENTAKLTWSALSEAGR